MVAARFLALVLCGLLAMPVAARSPAWELLERAESFYSGSGGRVDEREARSLFEKAEATGDPVARLRVATLRHFGLCGFPADPARAAGQAAPAFDAVRRLADSGDPAAQTTLATALLLGVGGPADPTAALPWYQKAAEQGQTPAMYNLGWMYGAGVGVPGDPVQSLAWYTKAAERGNAGAMLEAGLAHLRGVGTAKNAAEGSSWIRRAADRQHPRAMAELAWLLLSGRNIPEALSWLGRAVASGHPEAAEDLLARIAKEEIPRKDVQEAHRGLARIYENGWHGVPKDVDKARVLYRRARGRGIHRLAQVREAPGTGVDPLSPSGGGSTWIKVLQCAALLPRAALKCRKGNRECRDASPHWGIPSPKCRKKRAPAAFPPLRVAFPSHIAAKQRHQVAKQD